MSPGVDLALCVLGVWGTWLVPWLIVAAIMGAGWQILGVGVVVAVTSILPLMVAAKMEEDEN